jgi:hypothetical protein
MVKMSRGTSRACIACGAPLGANRTNEHIVAQWLLAELGISQERLTQLIADSARRETREARSPHAMDSFREGRICGKCNNGWMSTLESQAKEILPALVTGDRNITSLSDSEALVIARWTLKTAIVLSHAITLQRPLPAVHLRYLRANPQALPDQAGVFGAISSAAREFSYLQRNRWLNLVKSGTVVGEPNFAFMESEAYKVSFGLRRLLLMAAFIPRPSSHFLLAAGVHVPIWPNSVLPSMRVALEADPQSSPIEILSAFSNSLGAFHDFGQ